MVRRRDGFTAVELLVILVVAVVLLNAALGALAPVRNQFAVRGARQAFAALHARARAYAVERGTTAVVNVDAEGDSIWVSVSGSRVDGVNVRDEYGVDLTAYPSSTLQLCMTPRGFADTECNSFSSAAILVFSQGDKTASVSMGPLGHLYYF